MASLIAGFEYDVFISYRQKDNRGSRWVSEFVEALKTELESTFKEDVSIYFDENPHDGLLETNDVDASLKDKLKCLIFIPVISRTYCDPKSFAWGHEFKTFIDQASLDQFGMKIRLSNGNVSTRVLPIQIHDLDQEDIILCETILGGVLRGVDFIYKAPGVNRPLLANEEHPKDNLNKTYYRDQINKVANAINDIIRSLSRDDSEQAERTPRSDSREYIGVNKVKERFKTVLSRNQSNRKFILLISLVVCILSTYLIYRSLYHSNVEKTIAVIPFTNPANDNSLSMFAIGSAGEIIAKLQEIKSLTVRSRLSSLSYQDTKLPLSKLRNELNVNYLVEVSIRKIESKLVMWVGLTRTKSNKQLWAKQYDIDANQLMPLFTEIVQVIARNLNISFSAQEIINIEMDLTKKPDAYLNYISANARLFTAMGDKFVDSASFISAIKMYDKAIESDPGFAIAYSRRALARSWGIHSGQLNLTNSEKCWSDIENATRINKDLPDVQIALGFFYYYCTKDYINALISFNTASIKDP